MGIIKIACVIHSLSIGGMERVMTLLVNDFATRENVQVHLILIGRKRNIEYLLDKNVVIHKPNFKFDNRNRNWFTIKTIFFLRNTIKRLKPDTLLSFGELWNNLVILSLLNSPYPIFISDRSEPGKNLGKLNNFFRDKLYKRATGYIVQTDKAMEIAMRNNRNSNIKIIGNPVREISLPPVKKEKIVLSVGRLIRTKNFDQLIDLFAKINDPEWRLFIVGGNANNPDLQAELEQRIKDLGMEKRIKLWGEQKNVENFLFKSSIFAFTSTSEGFPNALAEALAARLPAVAYDCIAGPSDLIINGKNGFLVEEHNQEEFRNRLEELINSEALRNQFSNSSKEVLEKFRAEKISQRFFEVITQNTA